MNGAPPPGKAADKGQWGHGQHDAPRHFGRSREASLTTFREVADEHHAPTPNGESKHPTPTRLRAVKASLRDRWRTEVARSPFINDSTRVLLLILADDMREDGYVCVPRSELARRLDRTERKVSARLAEAVEARLLDRVQRGQKGRTAVYRALLRVPGTSTLNGSQGDGYKHPDLSAIRHPESGFRVTPGGPTCSKSPGATPGAEADSPLPTTSELLSLTEEGKDLARRAFASWGMELPAELREEGAA